MSLLGDVVAQVLHARFEVGDLLVADLYIIIQLLIFVFETRILFFYLLNFLFDLLVLLHRAIVCGVL